MLYPFNPVSCCNEAGLIELYDYAKAFEISKGGPYTNWVRSNVRGERKESHPKGYEYGSGH